MASRLAVLFSDGGMGDVGKHVVACALRQEGMHVRVLARSPRDLKTASVTQPDLDKAAKDRVEFIEMDISEEQDGSNVQLAAAFEGVDAVIACFGNRQGIQPMIADKGTRNVLSAMKLKGISRLVMLSSVGVADGWPPMPWSIFGKIFSLLMLTTLRKSYKDLKAASDQVENSALDYLLVCPTGLGPEEKPKGEYFLLEPKTKGGKLHFSIAKEDVAKYMLEEAQTPTRKRQAVTVGGDPAPKK